MSPPLSNVDVLLALPRFVVGTDGERLLRNCQAAIEPLIDELLETIGIPGRARVTVSVDDGLPAHRPLRLTVNGELCRYSDELLHWVASYVTDDPAHAELSIVEVWAEFRSRSTDDHEPSRTVVDLIAQTCMEILRHDASVLLGDEQVEAYASALAAPLRLAASRESWPPPSSWLAPILKEVVALRVAVADRPVVATILADAVSRDDTVEIIEDLVANLGSRICEIHLSPDTLDRLTSLDTAAVRKFFSLVRTELFKETGLDYPPFHIQVADDLKPGTFAFKIGALRTTPMHALRDDECLVNDTHDRLAIDGIASRRALYPATAQPAALVPLERRDRLGSERTAWDFQEHLMLCLATALRQHSRCFVDRSVTRSRLDFIRKAFPGTSTRVTAAGYTDVSVTRVLRAIAAEAISIRDVRRILELLVAEAECRRDDRLLLERVRAGMCRVIAEKHSRGTDTIVVYLLDPRIEAIASGSARRPRDDEWEAMVGAVRAELAYLPLTAQRPALLTTALARSMVRDVVASEFPRLSVICYDDLPGNVNVQPVARIGVGAPIAGRA